MGARAVLNAAPGRNDPISRWAVQLAERRGYWRAVVAIAAKNARMAWAVLSRGERFVLPSLIAEMAAAGETFYGPSARRQFRAGA